MNWAHWINGVASGKASGRASGLEHPGSKVGLDRFISVAPWISSIIQLAQVFIRASSVLA